MQGTQAVTTSWLHLSSFFAKFQEECALLISTNYFTPDQILGLSSDLRFLLFQNPIAMVGGIEKLKGIIISELECEPTNGDVYIFISKSLKVIKLLHYHHFVFFSKMSNRAVFLP